GRRARARLGAGARAPRHRARRVTVATLRYFAGARDAASPDTETADATTDGAPHAPLLPRPAGLAAVLPRCSLLVGGVRASSDAAPVGAVETVAALPPCAGG